MNDLLRVVLMGAGATVLLDLWGLLRRPLVGWPVPDYRQLGRWVGLMGRGRFWHVSIAQAPPVPGERAIGWLTHYVTGVIFAAMVPAVAGSQWLRDPTPGAALAVGIGSIAAPFLLMQPAMGAGIAASRMPDPPRARLQSLLTHAVFGIGLYVSALALQPRAA